VKDSFKLKEWLKRMKNFTTNWYLYNSLNSKKKPTENDTIQVETKEIKNKIKLIKKAIH